MLCGSGARSIGLSRYGQDRQDLGNCYLNYGPSTGAGNSAAPPRLPPYRPASPVVAVLVTIQLGLFRKKQIFVAPRQSTVNKVLPATIRPDIISSLRSSILILIDAPSHPDCRATVVPGGGLSPDGNRWVSCRAGYFLPVRVLSRLFRRLFTEALEKAFRAGALAFFSALADLNEPVAFQRYLAPVRRAEWVVYAKRPFAGPEQVLEYVGRYTHTPCRHLKQSHPRYRGRQGSLPVEGLSSRRRTENDDIEC
jgi:Putative transposase